MELYKEILIHALLQGEVKIIFPNQEIDQIVEGECYRTLTKIKEILHDDTLEDDTCFLKIEEIICAFEEMGSDGGNRHDFG